MPARFAAQALAAFKRLRQKREQPRERTLAEARTKGSLSTTAA